MENSTDTDTRRDAAILRAARRFEREIAAIERREEAEAEAEIAAGERRYAASLLGDEYRDRLATS